VLFARAMIAFLVMPGMVALAVPWWVGMRKLASDGVFHPVGLLPLVAGFALLLWCVYDFYASGKGTLAPWSPPKHLVIQGPYRYTRNPMYVGVLLMLAGWALTFWSTTLAIYTGIMMLGFQLRVVYGEEPWLARMHGAQWAEYRARVPRWLL
jgi:protein-S-isoprenylcysteine O-methyltransferase Ste14